MIGRPRVAAHAEVPIAPGRATAGGRLGRSSAAKSADGEARVIQRDYVLLVLGSGPRGADADLERAVLPNDVIAENRV